MKICQFAGGKPFSRDNNSIPFEVNEEFLLRDVIRSRRQHKDGTHHSPVSRKMLTGVSAQIFKEPETALLREGDRRGKIAGETKSIC